MRLLSVLKSSGQSYCSNRLYRTPGSSFLTCQAEQTVLVSQCQPACHPSEDLFRLKGTLKGIHKANEGTDSEIQDPFATGETVTRQGTNECVFPPLSPNGCLLSILSPFVWHCVVRRILLQSLWLFFLAPRKLKYFTDQDYPPLPHVCVSVCVARSTTGQGCHPWPSVSWMCSCEYELRKSVWLKKTVYRSTEFSGNWVAEFSE